MAKTVVQRKNLKTGLYEKIDKESGKIVAKKKTAGAFKGVAVQRKPGAKKKK